MSFERVALLTDLEEGMPFGTSLSDGTPVCLIRVVDQVYAVHDRCTHAEFTLSDSDMIDEHVIECGLHGAQFDVRTGEVLELPATERLPCFAAKIEQGEVLVSKT